MSSNTDSSWWSRTTTFLGEVKSEWQKVTTPNRDEVVSTTVVVLITSIIFALFLWLSDVVIIWLYDGSFELLGLK
ncbi:MAG: preprotein translocase subunit SecE [Acidobacteriota bacterium]